MTEVYLFRFVETSFFPFPFRSMLSAGIVAFVLRLCTTGASSSEKLEAVGFMPGFGFSSAVSVSFLAGSVVNLSARGFDGPEAAVFLAFGASKSEKSSSSSLPFFFLGLPNPMDLRVFSVACFLPLVVVTFPCASSESSTFWQRIILV